MSKITSELLGQIFPNTPKNLRDRFIKPFNTILPKYNITTEKRFAAFIANVGIESDRLKALEEYASGKAYEGRINLGDIRTGDGVRYKGRSVLQTTGRYNYWVVVVAYLRVLTGKNWDSQLAKSNFDAYLKSSEYTALLAEADKYNVNFLANPELLEQFPHAVEAAGIFVADKKLNDYADRGQFFEYAGILNKGNPRQKALHYQDRLDLYHKALKVIPDGFILDGTETAEIQTPEVITTEDVQESGHTPEIITSTSTSETTDSGTTITDTVTTTTPTTPKEKVAVVASKPTGIFSRVWTKITAAIMGNSIFQFGWDQIEKIQGLVVNPNVWLVLSIIVGALSLAWIIYEAIQAHQEKNRQKDIDKLLVQANSTPDNFVQLIPPDEAELYKLKGYKIITRG